MDSPISSSSSYLPYAAAAAAAAFFLYYATLHRLFRRSSTAPPLPSGPLGLPLVGSLPFLDPELHSFFARLAGIHGPIYRLRLGSKLAVVISSPALAGEVLRLHDHTFANRDVPAAGRAIAYGGSDIVWNSNGPTWRMLRRICVREMLSPSSLDAVYHLRRLELRAAVRHLHSLAGSPVDVGAQMFLAVLNVITGMLWGGTVQGEDERTSVGKDFRELVGEITELLGRPNVSDFFPALARFDVQGIEKKMRVLLERFDGIFSNIIEKKKTAADGEAKDFLEYMLKLEGEGKDSNTPFTLTNVKALLMDMVVGGSDTSSNTVEFAMAEMMNRPETMERAQEELDLVVGRDNVVEESHLPKLRYLAMVVKETLRLHPALPLLVPHCPSAPSSVGGRLVPAGSRVFINVWAIHRDPTVWKDPLEFRPERFAEAPAKWDFSGGGDFSYFPFGAGRRICAGIAMAERMVSYFLASLVHSFDWRLPEGTELDLSEKFGIVLKKKQPLVLMKQGNLAHSTV
ncbi:Flavonoid 3',5'-hydroxylase [Apostasia shenzhenica]|uniref:Flavonoid 3',5'-hydroxylase n=1 Tax=Apostasia shenzhenica TaxID=1088818 RepID=A0A2H9ZS65_9ASPA|nr:Flavonoid 3',5'-hydroxylase [Apostasia shenzhenica]